MTTKVILNKAGRVVIPRMLRKELHLNAGDELELKTEGETISLHPVRPKARL